MWIKICANTNLEDAQLAAQLGADAVGFVFAPSPRRVTPAEAARITPHLPKTVERIGVFPTLAAEPIAEAARIAHLDAVQIHGHLDPGLLRRLRALLPRRVKIIQTIHWTIQLADPDPTDEAAPTAPLTTNAAEVTRDLRTLAAANLADRVLIDSKLGTLDGGTGVAFDWTAARAILHAAAPGLKLIVAGGLRPQNVLQAIHLLTPWGIDVASGVESSPGRKSPEKLAAFLRNARA